VSSTTIDVVRGRLDPNTAEELIEFWAGEGALSGEDARRRLPEVVCVLRDDGRIAGACSVRAAEVPLIGGRRFWVYRSLLRAGLADRVPELISSTFDALAAEPVETAESPVGLCVLLRGEAERALYAEAEPVEPRLLYAGYLDDGRQVRVAYFDDISTGGLEGGWHTPFGIDLFSEQDAVARDDVTDLWLAEGVLSPEEAERRVDEVLLVATDGAGRPIGVSTTYLQYNHQLRANMWYYRAFVAAAHRRSDVGLVLALRGRDHHARRFYTGEDRRGIGVIFEVEHEGLKRFARGARWLPTDFMFIGENDRGDHVRVHYFPGAPAQGPDAGQGSA
jgi:hypothetical protein